MAAPVFDRQRIILDLLCQSRARPSHLQLMKGLFLLGQETEVRDAVPYYDFVPYRFGPFSFTVYSELRRLKDRGLVTETLEIPNGQRRAVDAQVERLKRKVREATRSIVTRYGDTKPRALLGDVYQRYDWFTSRSSLRSHEAMPVAEVAVYTAGYEGDSIDAFLNKLLEARMRRVIDVRKNAYSHKFGFSGGPLRKFCSKVGLDYQHVPDLGIPSKLRTDLSTTDKRKKLFARYKKEILPAEQGSSAARHRAAIRATVGAALHGAVSRGLPSWHARCCACAAGEAVHRSSLMNEKLEVLITVKAYPNPSKSLGEAGCIAGVSRAGKFVRLYPVPFRDLEGEQRFSKYQWISVKTRPARDDSRPETLRPDFSSIEVVSEVLPTAKNWAARYRFLKPVQAGSMCDIQDAQARDNTSLGFFRPKEILDIEAEAEESPTWQRGESSKLAQRDLFLTKEKKLLEKIPVGVYYRFRCDGYRNKDPHRMKIIDWELAELWRKDRRTHDEATTIARVKQRYLNELCGPEVDTHFFTGNMARFQSSFLVLGVFWPKKSTQTELF